MHAATGLGTDNSITNGGPWPQAAGNYCGIADIQGVVNYLDWANGSALAYPTEASQGPVTNSTAAGDPGAEQPGQILYNLDNKLAANFPPGPKVVSSGPNRRPYTLANISHDAGLDPRAIAAGIDDGIGFGLNYHMHVYHTSPDTVTYSIAYEVAAYKVPVVAIVNHGSHSVLVAGVWAYGNPATDSNVVIDSLAVYNSWDQRLYGFLGGVYYSRVPYNVFAHGYTSNGLWLATPYSTSGGYDPDPYMGVYQAGTDPYSGATSNPSSQFWLGNYVIIEPDNHADHSADNAYNESNQLMTGP